MRAVHSIELQSLSRVFGGHDDALVRRILQSTDTFVTERLAGCVASGFDPAAVLAAIVAGDVSALDAGAVMQVFDLVVHDLGEETSFLDEQWATDRALTALDKAKVRVDRGLEAPLPWPIDRSPTGVPMVFVWSNIDLETLASEIEAARARVTPDLSAEFAAIGTRVRGIIDRGKQIVGVDWL